MSADTGTRRSEDVIGAVDERSSLQWARRKIEEVKVRLRGDPGRAYSVEFTAAAEILREHDPVEFNSLRRCSKYMSLGFVETGLNDDEFGEPTYKLAEAALDKHR